MKPNQIEKRKIDPITFWPPFLIMLAVTGAGIFANDWFSNAMYAASTKATDLLDWVYLLIGLVSVFVSLFLLFSKWGNVKMGGKDAKPKYTYFQWFAMTLCGGIGIGIVFWGVAQPIENFAMPAEGIEPMSSEAVIWAMKYTFCNWALAPYSLYVVCALAISLAVHNHKQNLSVGSGLYYLVGEKHATGTIGRISTMLCILGLVSAIVAGMGQGLMQIGAGIEMISPFENNSTLWLFIAIFIMVAFTFSSALGMDKGLNWLSNQNVKIYAVVLVFIFIVGPGAYICRLFTESFGAYINDFVHIHTYLGVSRPEEDWARWWTVFQFAAMIAYAPIMGVFLSRMAYGRTVKEFVMMNLLLPSAFVMIWFSVFGGTAIDMQLTGKFDLVGAIAEKGEAVAVFEFFRQLPLGMVLVFVFLIVILISFITCADAMTSTIAILTIKGYSNEDGDAPLFMRVIWGVIICALAWAIVVAGGVSATKLLLILFTMPMDIVMIMMIASMFKGLSRNYKAQFENEVES